MAAERVSDLTFEVVDVRSERYAAVPTMVFRLRITEADARPIQSIVLRAQIQIEAQRRHYAPAEEGRLLELFDVPARWGQTLKPLLWTHATATVPTFEGVVEIDLPVTCTYDFEVTGAKYLHALDDGDIPLLFLFSGSVFARTGTGFAVDQVPWDRESTYRLPVRVWREMMDHYFPGGAWLRLGRGSFDALHRFKADRALPSWDAAVEALLESAALREPA